MRTHIFGKYLGEQKFLSQDSFYLFIKGPGEGFIQKKGRKSRDTVLLSCYININLIYLYSEKRIFIHSFMVFCIPIIIIKSL